MIEKWSNFRKIVLVGIFIGLVINVVNFVTPLPNADIINIIMVFISGGLECIWFGYVISDWRNKSTQHSKDSEMLKMTLRKGQHLFNEIARLHILNDHKCTMNKDRIDLFPYANLHMILYYMSDKQFDEIMSTLRPLSNVRGK